MMYYAEIVVVVARPFVQRKVTMATFNDAQRWALKRSLNTTRRPYDSLRRISQEMRYRWPWLISILDDIRTLSWWRSIEWHDRDEILSWDLEGILQPKRGGNGVHSILRPARSTTDKSPRARPSYYTVRRTLQCAKKKWSMHDWGLLTGGILKNIRPGCDPHRCI